MDMARPIQATPPIEGEDAERLLRELERVATREEMRRREEEARRLTNKLTGLKPKDSSEQQDD